MKNKTIADWLIWSLATTFIFYFAEFGDTLVGLATTLNWAWIIVAIVRLYKLDKPVVYPHKLDKPVVYPQQ